MNEQLNAIQNDIDDIAQKQLSSLCKNSHPYQINGCMAGFRTALSNRDIISGYIDEDEQIVQSDKIVMDVDTYFQYPSDLSKYVANYMGTKSIFVMNRVKAEYGVIFVGQANNVYATKILFECLCNIAAAIRSQYMTTLKRYKKQSTRDDKASDYMSDWLDTFIDSDSPPQWLDFSDALILNQYINKQFKSTEDEQKLLLMGYDIILEIHNIQEQHIDEQVNWREILYKTYPKELVERTFNELKALQNLDLVVVLPSWDNDDE